MYKPITPLKCEKHVFTDVGICIIRGRLKPYVRCTRCGLLSQKR